MINNIESQKHEGTGLSLNWFLVPWDTAIFGYPIAQIGSIKVLDESQAEDDFSYFNVWCNENDVKLVSCRLAHEKLCESMYLESKGFRFVEMVLHPILMNLFSIEFEQNELRVHQAKSTDIPSIRDIAGRAFHYERYHVDPRVDRNLANVRYQFWIDNAVAGNDQEILVIRDRDALIGFFIWERQQDGSAYWHLTAINPEYQGKGYGRKAWIALLNYHRTNGIKTLRTTISARNVPVLNLYASLGFRFEPPEMTFHWLTDQ